MHASKMKINLQLTTTYMSGDNLPACSCLKLSYSKHVEFYCFFLAVDIDECGTGRHSCANDTICFNLDGGYDCRCPHGKNCTGDCIHDGKVKHNGQIWVLENDRCSVCSCQVGTNKKFQHFFIEV